MLDVGLEGDREVPSMGHLREHACSAPAICFLLPRALTQAPNTCLWELLEKVPGEWLQSSPARLELQVVTGMTGDAMMCALRGERLSPQWMTRPSVCGSGEFQGREAPLGSYGYAASQGDGRATSTAT